MNIKIPLAKPDITDSGIKEVIRVLKSPYLALGPKVIEFEQKIAKYIGVKYAVATSSGTSALHLIIKALGISEGDEVITTPFSFIASANCILYEGAKPVFVDIDEKTFNIDVAKIEEKITTLPAGRREKLKAILAVDIFSQPADWQELKKIAQKHKLFLIEDSAEALGSEYQTSRFIPCNSSGIKKGKKCGSFGDAAILAFYPNKQITTGEGGAVLTNNKKIYELCQSMVNQGREAKNGKWLSHIRLGYNYRMDEMSAALGIVQMKRLKEILKNRKRVAGLYNKKLKDIEDLEIPYIKPGNKLSWFVYVAKLNEKLAGKKRDKIIKEMANRGIQCSNYFQSIHLQPFYKKMFGYKPGNFPISESVSQRTITLPFYNNLREKEIDRIIKNLKEIISELK